MPGMRVAGEVGMTMKRTLQLILAVGLFGAAFSGVLSYQELLAPSPVMACPSPGAPGTVFGYPACVYGFFMYLVVSGLAGWGLLAGRRKKGPPRREETQELRDVVRHPIG